MWQSERRVWSRIICAQSLSLVLSSTNTQACLSIHFFFIRGLYKEQLPASFISDYTRKPRMNIQNLSSYGMFFYIASLVSHSLLDPFADTGEENLHTVEGKDTNEKKQAAQQNYIHIRVQQRNGRKTLTTLQGLPKGT